MGETLTTRHFWPAARQLALRFAGSRALAQVASEPWSDRPEKTRTVRRVPSSSAARRIFDVSLRIRGLFLKVLHHE